jgi:hypothetical protein
VRIAIKPSYPSPSHRRSNQGSVEQSQIADKRRRHPQQLHDHSNDDRANGDDFNDVIPELLISLTPPTSMPG